MLGVGRCLRLRDGRYVPARELGTGSDAELPIDPTKVRLDGLHTHEESVRGFREILDGKHDQLPEQAFYMVGSIEEAVEQAEQMGSAA